jgi:hypothetical protein
MPAKVGCCSAMSIRLQKMNTAKATAAANKAVKAAAKNGVKPKKAAPKKASAKKTAAKKTKPCRMCGKK